MGTFILTEDQITQIIDGFVNWLEDNPDEAAYAQKFRDKAKSIREDFLDAESLEGTSNDELYQKIFNYSRSLEGPAYIRLGETRIRDNLSNLRKAFNYIIGSGDSPFRIAENILDGEYKIDVFAKAFWSPILQARFPDTLPNWNNKTEQFLKRVGLNLSSSKLNVAEKYKALSDAFKYIISLDSNQDFYSINHLMHYGTVIKEGDQLIRSLLPDQFDPISDMIERYKAKIRETKLDDEIYKWQLTKKYHHRPNTESENFAEEYSSIDYSNLIYHNAKGVGNHLAKDRTEEFREQFRNLFDESVDLQTRITKFDTETLSIYREIWSVETDSHHQDERTIATYLAFYDANKYPFYKDSFYRKYCELIGVKHNSKGKKYIHYIQLLDELIESYITTDDELLRLKDELLPEDAHEDKSHYIFAQDILYQMLDKKISNVKNYWRVGTTDSEGNSKWSKLKENNYVAIGWPEIGDLSAKEIEKKKDMIVLLEKANYYSDNKSAQSNQAGQLYNFYNDINNGDIIVAQDGQKVKGIGIVVGEYLYIQDNDFPHTKAVDWKVFDPDITNQKGLRTTVYKLDDPHLIHQVDVLLSDNNNGINPPKIPESLNLILYGPPGTGKTYHTIDFSVKIAAPDEYIANNHVANKKTFDKLLKEGQVVFTTFHQSMSYEDFIEGIKPMEPLKEGDPVTYKVVDGVFKQLCKSASTLTSTTFELSYEKLLNDLDETESGFELTTSDGEIFTISCHPNGIDLGVESNSYISSITKSGLKYVSDSQKYAGVWGKYYKAIFKLLTENYGYEYDRRDPNKNFVLIIDEINRGNVSEIFGELITLIEEDKRLGGDEAMQIVLPYSKQKFGAPSNIYILGTMNTADRSVEALDTALRRRFSFIEMMTRYDLSDLNFKIGGYSLSDILKVVNYRIEKLMDRDHQIGHSYFLKVKTDSELQQVFKDKIIPLLQEYFYGDYEKLGLILGSGFIGKNGMEDPGFASFSVEDPDVFDKPIYELKTEPFASISAFKSAIDSLFNNKQL